MLSVTSNGQSPISLLFDHDSTANTTVTASGLMSHKLKGMSNE
jgi:hypothetical protein